MKVYVTRNIPDEAMGLLQENCDVRRWDYEHDPVPREVLEREIEDVDGLYCMLTDTIDEALLQKAKRLKVISNLAVGYNNIDVEAATKRGIYVTNTPDVLTETTADLTFALMMATARRLVEASDYLREGRWSSWSPMLLAGQDVYGATLGIIGMGRIGEAIARRAKGFDMNVLYSNRNRKPEAEQTHGFTYVDKETLLQESDFVCVMTPLTPETKNLIGEKELGMMKPSAVLINSARGGVVDEKALYDALKAGRIWGAGLDVFENEPIAPDHPLLSLSNVVTLPHIGSASIRTRTKMAVMAAEDLMMGMKGETPLHLVNQDVTDM